MIPYTKIKYKWIKGLNVRCETVNLIKENIGSKLFDIGLINYFFHFSLQARVTKAKINKLDYIKLKSFFNMERKYPQNEKKAY